MKQIKNKIIKIKISTLEQNTNNENFIRVEQEVNATYSDLLIQISKLQKGNEGIGDLEEQYIRLKIIDKCKKSITNENINLENEEVKLIKELINYWKLVILHKDLIEFQKLLKDL